jgi:hypothetical protein
MLMLKKTHSAKTASAIILLPGSSNPRLIDEEGRAPLFQDSFVGHGKWFRGSSVHPDDER